MECKAYPSDVTDMRIGNANGLLAPPPRKHPPPAATPRAAPRGLDRHRQLGREGPLGLPQGEGLGQAVYGRLAALPVDAHPHMLRHACGFALADQGADTRLIQDYLGHRNIQHTVMYTATNLARFERLWRQAERCERLIFLVQ